MSWTGQQDWRGSRRPVHTDTRKPSMWIFLPKWSAKAWKQGGFLSRSCWLHACEPLVRLVIGTEQPAYSKAGSSTASGPCPIGRKPKDWHHNGQTFCSFRSLQVCFVDLDIQICFHSQFTSLSFWSSWELLRWQTVDDAAEAASVNWEKDTAPLGQSGFGCMSTNDTKFSVHSFSNALKGGTSAGLSLYHGDCLAKWKAEIVFDFWLFSYHKLHYAITKMLSTASCKVFAHLAFRFRFACHRTGRGNILIQRWKMTWQSSCGFAFRFPTFHFGPDQEQSRTDPCLVSVSGTMEEVELAVRQIRCLHQKQRPFGLDNSIYSLESRTLLQDFDSL